MAQDMTYDSAYDTVDRDDFDALIEADRYADRSGAFDSIISATVDHFWDPTDDRYVTFGQDFNMAEETVLPRDFTVELQCSVADKLDERQQIRLANQSTRFILSSILHGEQGAMSLSASLCQIMRDPGAQEYAANQTREEARHVAAFTRYIDARWGSPLRAGPTLRGLMNEIVLSPLVYKKLVGMQMLIEGLAMGAFATIHAQTHDPVLKRVVQLVMSDEAFHHKFGKIWADKTVPKLTEQEHVQVEDWAAHCFKHLLNNLINAEQKQEIYKEFGLEWSWVRSSILEAFGDADRRADMQKSTNIFRVLIKTLLKAGIITDRTKPVYSTWVDMEELALEADEVVGSDLAEATVEELREINRGRKKMVRMLRAPSDVN
jgi:hypothetical protein